MKHSTTISLRLKMRLHTAVLLLLLFLISVLILPVLAGCEKQNSDGYEKTQGDTPTLQQASEDDISSSEQATQGNASPLQQAPEEGGWEDLFAYDETKTVQFKVMAAIAGDEESYEYPWGGYDDLGGIQSEETRSGDIQPEDIPTGSKASDGGATDKSTDTAQTNEKLLKALEAMSPEKRKIAEEAMSKAQERAQSAAISTENVELPPDWNDESNLPILGGQLELQNGDSKLIIEMSEYCVENDTVFTVTPIKENKLPGEIIKSGFSLSAGNQKHVTLNDYAVITFLTEEDPGDDVVIKSFNDDGAMEYTPAEVAKYGDMFMITGAVEHFSTVGYGSPELSPEAKAALNESAHRELVEASKRLSEKMRYDKKGEDYYKSLKTLETIEFDEIVFTTSATGDPLQLHLRAKLVEQPYELNSATNMPERYFTGKVWLKFYTWMPDGYGDIYMICNNARIPSFYGLSTPGGVTDISATLQMTTIGGSRAVSYGVGEYGISGKTYSDVQTTWRLDPKTHTMQLSFDSMKGAAEKTFITGKLRERSRKQANKKLKWFLK